MKIMINQTILASYYPGYEAKAGMRRKKLTAIPGIVKKGRNIKETLVEGTTQQMAANIAIIAPDCIIIINIIIWILNQLYTVEPPIKDSLKEDKPLNKYLLCTLYLK